MTWNDGKSRRYAEFADEARKIARLTKSRMCVHSVMPWLCNDCRPVDRTRTLLDPYDDTELPEGDQA